ncbi:unnamed protein product [Musa acuminata subsp. burmannicoides]
MGSEVRFQLCQLCHLVTSSYPGLMDSAQAQHISVNIIIVSERGGVPSHPWRRRKGLISQNSN